MNVWEAKRDKVRHWLESIYHGIFHLRLAAALMLGPQVASMAIVGMRDQRPNNTGPDPDILSGQYHGSGVIDCFGSRISRYDNKVALLRLLIG